MGVKINDLPAAILADLDDNDTLFEIQDMAEAAPADQSKKLTLGIMRDWLAAAAFAALAITGNFSVATNKFTVAAASGNTLVAGTLAVTGDVAIGADKFNVTAASGNTQIDGTLNADGNFSIATNKFTVLAASGNTNVAGTFNSVGDFSVATNKFTVAAASGNTVSAGSMTVVAGFGCNTKAAQGAFASGGALAGYVTGAFGLDSDAHMHAMFDLVVNIRAALVANGIMS